MYQELYSNLNIKQKQNPRTDNNKEQEKAITEPKILPREIEKAIFSQKMEKAAGPDKVTNELLKGTPRGTITNTNFTIQ